MKIGIIGAGKVGCALALGFNRIGYNISGICNRSQQSFEYLVRIVGGSYNNSLYDTVRESDIVFIAVSDSSIKSVVNEIILKAGNNNLAGKAYFHLSGALTSDVLLPLKELGGVIASLHPIQTFGDKQNGWEKLKGIYFGFEGCNKSKEIITPLIKKLGSFLIKIKKEDKPLYHAAACFVSNYSLGLFYIASQLLNSIGLNSDVSSKAFLPLLQGTVQNIADLGPVEGLTGPISRGDTNVVEEHIRALQKTSQEFLEIYKAMGKIATEIGCKKESINKEKELELYTLLK